MIFLFYRLINDLIKDVLTKQYSLVSDFKVSTETIKTIKTSCA